MRLRSLVGDASTLFGADDQSIQMIGIADDADPVLDDVVMDSRQVQPGSLFCCVPGQQFDGHGYAAEAVAAGAVALLVDHPLEIAVPQIVVDDVRRALGPISNAFFARPSDAMAVVGITGTNGKTTTAHLLGNIVGAAGSSVEVLGTLTGARTTPEAPELQRRLAEWRDASVDVVAMEVSSHALALHRVDATRFRVAVFTNLSRDHLDFHGSMEQYFETKARLFTPSFSEAAVVNLDSPYGRLLSDSSTITTVGYSAAEIDELHMSVDGSRFLWRGRQVLLPLAGEFNVSNALAAAHAALLLGFDEEDVVVGLNRPLVVPGRFERVELGASFTVIVDFAHTPDGLEQVLIAADTVTGSEGVDPAVRGRVIVVFGCGGDRDPSKRAPMGAVAVERADVVVLTADNSRSESTEAIIDGIATGVERSSGRRATRIVREPDRRRAIAAALAAAGPGDIVVIAGKGHESTLTIGDTVMQFDDRRVAKEVWQEMGEVS
jgi:UDP-N-acetylmuramoyl-L-alanyl-D-glutamate--2,6-diaminopimelate ligase